MNKIMVKKLIWTGMTNFQESGLDKHYCKKLKWAGLDGSVDCASDWWSWGNSFNPCRLGQHSFKEIDQKILCTVILFFLLILEGQLSVSSINRAQLLVNYLEPAQENYGYVNWPAEHDFNNVDRAFKLKTKQKA